MDVRGDRVTELQQEVAKTLLADAPEGWEQLGCRFTVVGGYGSLNAFAVVNGDKERIRAAMVGSHGLDLQEAMYTPGEGDVVVDDLQCRAHSGVPLHLQLLRQAG